MLLTSLPTLTYLTVFFKHLVWILGLKPGAGGVLKPGRAVEGPSTVSNPAVSIDLWFLLSAQEGKKTAHVFNPQGADHSGDDRPARYLQYLVPTLWKLPVRTISV